MSSDRGPPALRLELKPSRRLAAVLGCAHAGAAVAAIMVTSGPLEQAGVLALLFVSLWRALRRHALLLSRGAVTVVELYGESACRALLRDGKCIECRIQSSSYVVPRLVVLHLRADDSRFARHVVLFPNSVSAERLRRLRVRLRWAGHAPGEVDVADASL